MNVNISGTIRHSFVNGPGTRYVLFFQGCKHNCIGCQNPETHDPIAGYKTDTDAIVFDILNTKFIDGITFSGGDPLMQSSALYEIIQGIRNQMPEQSIWCYTGWTYEELIFGKNGNETLKLLPYIDILVDGRFISNMKDGNHIWRGSSNQRLIDVKQSLSTQHTIILT